MKKFGAFVALCILGMSILACGSATASQPTPINLPTHEPFLLSNDFTYSSSFTNKCKGPCRAYFNEQYNMRVELYNNGDLTIAFGEIDESLTEAQGTLLISLVHEFFGPDASSWVVDNIKKSIDNEQTADINGYRLFMQIVSQPLVFGLMATPLH
jgi:hypothetical protein